MTNYIAIDFGASRIKSIAFNNQKKVTHKYETQGSNYFGSKSIDPIFFYSSFIKHLEYYYQKFEILNVIVSSEMHGYSIYDANINKLSDYYSWRYHNKKKTISKTLKSLVKNEFKLHTGLKIRKGLPIVNYFSGKKKDSKNKFLCGVGEIICVLGGKYNGNLHSSYAQSTGFYKLNNQIYLTQKNNFLNKVRNDKKNLIGKIKYNKKIISLHGGYGDLQVAFLGSNLKKNEILINMGTGSQIIKKNKIRTTLNYFEERNYFGEILNCITHIPSGRSLDVIAKAIDKKLGKKNYFWDLAKILSIKHLVTCNDSINLDLLKLKGITKYVKNIEINNLKNFVTTVLKSYCDQYIFFLTEKVIKTLDVRTIVLSGGIPKKIPVIQSYIKKKTKLSVKVDKSKLDETLKGLLILSKFNK
jgi:hypothetical protein